MMPKPFRMRARERESERERARVREREREKTTKQKREETNRLSPLRPFGFSQYLLTLFLLEGFGLSLIKSQEARLGDVVFPFGLIMKATETDQHVGTMGVFILKSTSVIRSCP